MSTLQRRPSKLGRWEHLVFHHIPKTAGTSVQMVLSEPLNPKYVLNYTEGAGTLARVAGDRLQTTRFLTGHLTYWDVDAVPEPRRVITFLRKPKERILSLYYFWRAMRDEFLASLGMEVLSLAKTRGLLQFLRSSERFVRYQIDNALVRPFVYTDYPLAPDIAKLPPQELAAMALERLRSTYHFVGFHETFAEDFEAVQRSIGRYPRPMQRRYNDLSDLLAKSPDKFQTVERENITPDIDAELDRLTAVDSIFYAMAFRERMTLRPDLSNLTRWDRFKAYLPPYR